VDLEILIESAGTFGAAAITIAAIFAGCDGMTAGTRVGARISTTREQIDANEQQ
jgi:hypothetical protein